MDLSTAFELMRKKIYCNELYKKSYIIGIETQKHIMEINKKTMENLEYKIRLVDELNDTYKAQMTRFEPSRQDQSLEICKQLNDVDDDDVIKEIKCKIAVLKASNDKICQEIKEIEATIPDQQLITNFKIKRSM